MSQPLLRLENLTVHFPVTRGTVLRRTTGFVRAVDGVTFDIGEGETVGLVGESGSGKTTLGRAIVGLVPPTAGSIELRGVELSALRGRRARRARSQIQMVFQDPFASLDPRWPVARSVGEPLRLHRVGTRRERHERVLELLELVGLSRRMADRFPHELSGGQRQRVGLARALALRPALVVADEAVSALDVSIQAQILNLLQRLQQELGLAYLFIAHDLAVVHQISDRVAVMYLGRIVELAPAVDLYREPRHPYTISLLSANPVPDPSIEAGRERIVLPGDPPSAAAPPPGCRFHTRCWLRERLGDAEICRTQEPPLREAGPGRSVACHFADEAASSPVTRRAVDLAGGRS
ncbi:MAG TPA: ABC transporter ATP-binding protein [Actinomycetota bacterium]|nr:ABC transporter ATP-binding protein [Actinomycetota bacterium]